MARRDSLGVFFKEAAMRHKSTPILEIHVGEGLCDKNGSCIRFYELGDDK